jgi:hypothetical protein
MLNTSFFFVVSTRAYLVNKTYKGLSKVVAMAVEAIVFKMSQPTPGPAKNLIISKI